jgi:hypothetical protein
MNKLKEYAGLLNEAAPKNHFLAYITEDEKDMLVKAGGKETATPSGILAYPPPGEYGGAGYVGSAGTGTGSGHRGGGADRDPQPVSSPQPRDPQPVSSPQPQDRIQRIGSGIEPGYRPQDAQPYGLSKEEAYRQGKITKDQYESTDVAIDRSIQESPSWFDGIKNYIESGGMIGMAINLTGEVLSKLGEYSSELQKKAMIMALNSRIKSRLKDLDITNPNELANDERLSKLQNDLMGVKDGTYTQSQFTKDYTNINLGGEGEGKDRELMNTFVPYAAHAVGGTTPQSSMVNEYFANLGNTNLGISNDFMTKYNTAKTNMASILDMTPNTQQYGYGNTFASTYPRAMNSGNVFYQYLNEQGLI